jgi:hypothetical protein
VRKLLFFCLIYLGITPSLWAQLSRTGTPVSNLRNKAISTKADKIQLDTLSILPNTFSIPGINKDWYKIDYIDASLTWKEKPPVDSVWVQYRVFDAKLNAVTKHLNYDSIMNYFLADHAYTVNDNSFRQSDRFFDFGTINYTGSFGRGIAFGNSQDAVVTSSLNLQLNGYLADSIEIVAAITDSNIPLQPDGTTQQLNDFDRIFLEFKKKTWALSLGDIDIRQNKSYFLSFYKRLQGVAFETTSKLAPNITNTSLLSGSIAKGKFTRNIFQGQEGNQGPYRLTGANNEFYFTLLANTEKVYIDGELLQRGEDRDYVINYNTAEVTFTPKRMITKDSRIQIEFEYSDRNYLNANLYFSNLTNFSNKLRVTVSAFNNSDSKNSPINQTLDPAQKQFLRGLGDSISNAYYKNSTLDTFAAGKILYKKIDTTYNNGITHDSVFVYSISPDSAIYTLSFADVGVGKGDYVPVFDAANGKVYAWVAPVNGVKQGEFEAAIFLVTPKKQQLVSVLVDYDVTKKTNITTELAYSDYDINTFSKIDKGNDKGYAAKIKLTNTKDFGGEKKYKLLSNAGLEYVDANFHPLEVLRNVEFLRDWGLPFVLPAATETIVTGGAKLEDGKRNSFTYQLTDYKRNNDFNGIRNTITQTQTVKGWLFNNQFNLSNTNSTLEKGYFLRPLIDVSKTFKKLWNYSIGANYSLEHNEVRNKLADSVNASSFSFQTLSFTLKSPGKSNHWGLSYTTRTNEYPFGKNLVKSDISHNINFTGELLKNPHQKFRWNITYRKLDIINSAVTTQQADQSILGRGEYQLDAWKGLLTGNVLYEAGSGQEQKRDYAFLEVPAGQGQYTWIDYNGDGVQQLNEFEIAQFQDQAKYIKIYTPSNVFIKANYNTFNYSLNINPRAAIDIKKAAGVKKFVSRLNFQSSLQIAKKEIASGIVQLNPFKIPLNDTSLISLTSIFINSFSFNRFSTKWGLDISNSHNNGKTLLTYGLESRSVSDWTTRVRVNISKAMLFDITGKTGTSVLATDNQKFDNQNYDISQYSFEPRISYTKGTTLRFITSYKYTNKKNKEGDDETYSSNSINTEVKYNILQSGSVLTKFTYSNISFLPLANVNSTVGYNMLDGLSTGKNYLWSIELTKRLANNLEINVQYEGRKPGDTRVVHVGRASVRAIF